MFRLISGRHGGAESVVLIVIVLALAAASAWYFLLRSTPERSVTMMLEAARAGEEETMAEYLTARSPRGGTLPFILGRRLAGGPEGEPGYTVGEASIDNDRATVPVTFPLTGMTARLLGRDSVTVPYVLHREQGTWLVDTGDTTAEIRREIAGSTFDLIERFIVPEGLPET